jgi:ABC-2 type transport system permease protein
MRAYRALIATRFRTLLQYRAAAGASVFTQIFFGLVHIMVLEAFYRSSDRTAPLTFEQMVGYVWLGQATLAMFPWNIDADIRDTVREGTVAYELCRPLDLYSLWFCRTLAWRAAPVMLRFLPLVLLVGVGLPLLGLGEWRLRPPPSAAAGGLWAASMAGALFLSCALTTLMHATLLWTVTGQGTFVLLSALTTMFGGLVIPLPLLPDWARPFIQALPFAGTMDLPGRLYTGNIPVGGQAAGALLHQVGWTLALVGFGRAVLARGLRNLVVAGG